MRWAILGAVVVLAIGYGAVSFLGHRPADEREPAETAAPPKEADDPASIPPPQLPDTAETEQAAQPASREPATVTDHRGEGSRVLQSVYDFYNQPGTEAGDYALYSYALVPLPGSRADAFFSALFTHTGARAGSGLPNHLLNIILLPTGPDFQGESVEPDESATFAQSGYDYAEARDTLARLCVGRHDELEQFCADDPTGGPYMISFKVPATGPLTESTTPEPFLFVDLTDIHPNAFAEILDAYKTQVRRDEFDDSDPTETLRSRILSITLTAADWVNPVRSALADIMATVGSD